MDRKIEELERLARLRESGALSLNEFDWEKARILGQPIPGDVGWMPVAPWFPRRYIRTALTAVAVCCVVGLAAGLVVYRSMARVGPPIARPSGMASEAGQLPRYPTAAPTPSESAPRPLDEPCDPATRREIARTADLPGGALEALGGRMADVGEDFQVTDDIGPGDLPGRRFVSARQADCRISLRYEQGGVAHTFETAELVFVQGRWTKAPGP